jgi:hypothetical protein
LVGSKQTCIVGNEEADVSIVKNGSNTDETSTSTGDNGDILPGVLARQALSVHLVVQVGHCLSQWLDASSRAVFAAVDTDVDRLRAGKATLDVVLNLGDVNSLSRTKCSTAW